METKAIAVRAEALQYLTAIRHSGSQRESNICCWESSRPSISRLRRSSDLGEETIREAASIEQWAFFFLFADRYEPERLRELLPGVEFQRAITVIEAIAAKTEDRVMYDQREKAQRDYR